MIVIHNNKGYSLIEIMIAMVIFSIVAVSLLFAITNADKIKAHGTMISGVSTLARNESESIKNIAFQNAPLNDTTYDVFYNKREFTVERKRINEGTVEQFDEQSDKTLQELLIVIYDKNNPEKKWSFNLVQGFTN